MSQRNRTMDLIRFEPLDSLFFRDGRPYDQGEHGQADVASLFPPPPPSLVGAVRAAGARALGWKSGHWNEAVRRRLGDRESLDPLRFRGPLLIRNHGKANTCLFPAPANLVGRSESGTIEPESLSLLYPGTSGARCDLGENVRLPSAERIAEGAKPLCRNGWWIAREGLERILQGEPPRPDELVHRSRIWREEPRVGIARNPETRTTGEGAMYSPRHVRLAAGIALALEVDNLPSECRSFLESGPHPVGGESRMCWMRLDDCGLTLPKSPPWPNANGRIRYSITILTPADTAKPPLPGDLDYAGLRGKVVSACLPPPVVIGGWNSEKRTPLPLKPCLAPGSVIFLETDAAIPEPGAIVGERTNWGFGLVAVGAWN